MFSIIIPVYNEAGKIATTIRKTQSGNTKHVAEIIVVDGGSTDDTFQIAQECGATVIKSLRKGRASQMNSGASVANHKILYFLHADSTVPKDFTSAILHSMRKGAKSGCFRLQFDYANWFLKANAWFTRFNVNAIRFGDQSLFVMKDVFQKSGGFREDLLIMEDQEIIHRLKKYGKFEVINEYIITSARKYVENGIYRTQVIFYLIWAMYYLGFSQERMIKVYTKLSTGTKTLNKT